MARMANRKVLVVDDHVPTRSLIRTILEAEKSDTYEVIEAGNGTDCLKAPTATGHST
jgi:CheY-like chemotaxis protein